MPTLDGGFTIRITAVVGRVCEILVIPSALSYYCHDFVNISLVNAVRSHEGCKVFSLPFNDAWAGCRVGVVRFGSGRDRSCPFFV